MKKSFFALLLGCVLLLNSCVAFFFPKKQKVEINSANEANELSEGNQVMGKGKTVTYKLDKRGTTVHQVDITAKGYKTSHQVIYPKGRSPIIYPLQLIYAPVFFLPSVFDLGANYPFVYHKKITLGPSQELPKYDALGKRIYLDGVSIDEDVISSNSYMLKVKHKKKDVLTEIQAKDVAENLTVLDESLLKFDAQASNEAIHYYLVESGFIDTVNTVFKDNNNTISIEGSLKKYTRYNVNVKGFYPYYKAKGEVVWYFRNNFDEIFDSVVRTDYSDDFVAESNQELISDVFQNSYVNLLKSEEFKAKTRNNMDFTTKEAALKINKPQSVVRNLTDALDASVVVRTKNGHGSGFAISNDGYLLTNYHVVSSGEAVGDSNEIWIPQADGGKLKARLVRFNKYRDIALLKVDSTFSKAFQLDDLKGHKTFQEVYTIGAPRYAELLKSYQKGIISNDRSAFGIDIIQVSMAVNGGNSGGPLFDPTGKLHGVIVSKLVGFSTEGIGFAIPSHKVSEYLNIKQ